MSSPDRLRNFAAEPFSNVELVSFDVFGTLVQRCVPDRGRFYECVERMALRRGIVVEEKISTIRELSEEEAIKRFGSEGLTIERIYEVFAEKTNESVAASVREIEEQAEIDLCFPVTEMVTFFESCCAKFKTVLISDMYMHKEVIEKILSRCGVHGYKWLYVSSDCGCNKSSGALFHFVGSREEIPLKRIVHIGDTYSADYRIPRSLGAQALLVRGGETLRFPLLSRVVEKLGIGRRGARPFTFNSWEKCPEKIAAKEAGFGVLGPLLYALSLWFHEQKELEDLDALLFLSRDGYIMRQAYEIVFPGEENAYVYGSRKAMVVPTLWMNPTYEDIVRTLGFAGVTTISEFVKRVGLSLKDVGTELSSCGIAQDDVFDLSCPPDRFMRFFALIQESIISNSKREFETYVAYLKTFMREGRRYGLVDIGWRGNMQRGMCRVLERAGVLSSDIVGLYVGMYPTFNWSSKYEMRAFLFDGGVSQCYLDREQCYNNLFESLFFAPHGTVEGFEMRADGMPIPVLGDYEYDEYSHSFFLEVQEEAIKYVRLAAERNLGEYLKFNREFILRLVDSFGIRPTRNEAIAFGNCVTDYQGTPEYLAKAQKFRHYFAKPLDFIEDIKHCWWKPGFLTRVFGDRLPVGELFYRAKLHAKGPGFDAWGKILSEKPSPQ